MNRMMKRIHCLAFILLTATTLNVTAQSVTERYRRFLTKPEGYVCQRTTTPIHIDGIADEASWQTAPLTVPFTDISGEGFPAPRFNTQARMLWDDDYLYITAQLEEPHVWANLLQRDTIVYYDNDFEVFIDPTGDAHNYYEIEVNAIGTLFDLSIEKPYRSPRRGYVQFQWDCPGLKVATHVDGTVNKADDKDRGWTVEMAIPRKAVAAEFDNCLKAGNYLRVGFSRVEWQHQIDKNGRYSRKKDDNGKFLPENNWTWGATGQIAMHMPERWGYVYLSDQVAGSDKETFRYPASYPVERLLWAMFYAQEEQYARSGRYYANLEDFHLTNEETGSLPKSSLIKVEAISHKYEITITPPDGKQVSIDESGQLLGPAKTSY